MSHHGGSSHSTDGQDKELLLSFWRAATAHVTAVCGQITLSLWFYQSEKFLKKEKVEKHRLG